MQFLGTALFWFITQGDVVIYNQSFGENLSVQSEDESMAGTIYLAAEAWNDAKYESFGTWQSHLLCEVRAGSGINPLRRKLYLSDVKTQIVPRSKHSLAVL